MDAEIMVHPILAPFCLHPTVLRAILLSVIAFDKYVKCYTIGVKCDIANLATKCADIFASNWMQRLNLDAIRI